MTSINEILGYTPPEFVNKVDSLTLNNNTETISVDILSVSECNRKHSGNFKVHGTIISMSRIYKLIKSVTLKCDDCNDEQTKIYKPPINPNQFQLNKKCLRCEEYTVIPQFQFVNAVTVTLQDSDKFSDIEELLCVLLDDDTIDIQLGTKVIISGNIHIINQKNKKSISYFFATSLHYENIEKMELTRSDIQAIERFTKLKGRMIIDSLTDMFAPSCYWFKH